MAQIEDAANIVRDAGGKLVGRTRLQKLAFLLEVSGLGAGFNFEYRRFGPYSDELNICTRDAVLLRLLDEEELAAAWGGTYSIFTTEGGPTKNVSPARLKLAGVATGADPVELELAATAVFLSREGMKKAWKEVRRRKPDKAKGGRLDNSKLLYQELKRVNTPVPLPEIV